MTPESTMGDLVALVADKDCEAVLRGLLEKRRGSLKIRSLKFKIFVHPERDPGCRLRSADLLRQFLRLYAHALVIFDHEGSGYKKQDRRLLETEVEEGLRASGWEGRARAVVIEPELENWVWSDSPHVASALGWETSPGDLRQWMEDSGFLKPDEAKPRRPKEAMQSALRRSGKSRSSSIFREITEGVSLLHCTDESFLKLRETLREWFGEESNHL